MTKIVMQVVMVMTRTKLRRSICREKVVALLFFRCSLLLWVVLTTQAWTLMTVMMVKMPMVNINMMVPVNAMVTM